METIGVRTLKSQATAIVRRVREEGASFEMSYRGRPVARITPLVSTRTDQSNQLSVEEYLKLIDETAASISRDWPPGVSALDAVREGCRDL